MLREKIKESLSIALAIYFVICGVFVTSVIGICAFGLGECKIEKAK